MISSLNHKVSVIVPNYNYGKYLRKRINSILKQTYPISELIILDDASTDDSIKIINVLIMEIKNKYPDLSIRLFQNDTNSGKAIYQWKKAFELASNNYIWIAEADDLSKRHFLEKAMDGFRDPDVVLSYTESEIINGIGLMIMPNFRHSRDKEKTGHYANDYIKDGRCEIEEIMAIRCTIPNVSAVVFCKKEGIPYTDYLDEATKFSQVGDWYFYMMLLKHGKISYKHNALNRFRVHEGSKTSNSKHDRTHYDEVVEIHKWLMAKFNLDDLTKKRMKAEEMRILKKHDIIERE
ncbi:glycosyltransferase family 2 protein [Candidatus Saccharibacteria bacterium]|nr:glycosyltransferase family 2 protein [Candidatus Saccharibacteria bacterium]